MKCFSSYFAIALICKDEPEQTNFKKFFYQELLVGHLKMMWKLWPCKYLTKIICTLVTWKKHCVQA